MAYQCDEVASKSFSSFYYQNWWHIYIITYTIDGSKKKVFKIHWNVEHFNAKKVTFINTNANQFVESITRI